MSMIRLGMAIFTPGRNGGLPGAGDTAGRRDRVVRDHRHQPLAESDEETYNLARPVRLHVAHHRDDQLAAISERYSAPSRKRQREQERQRRIFQVARNDEPLQPSAKAIPAQDCREGPVICW